MNRGQSSGSSSTVESSPARRKRHSDYLAREQRRNEKRAGKVTMRMMTPDELERGLPDPPKLKR